MSSREISFWIDERWYDALNKHLKDETLEEHLENMIDEMCNQLPQWEYERISGEIWQEEQRRKQEQEAGRRFSIFHVTECGEEKYFLAEEPWELLQIASKMRSYTRKPHDAWPMRVTGLFSHGSQITPEQFQIFAAERLDNTGRVTGAFEINFDRGQIDTMNIMDGCQCSVLRTSASPPISLSNVVTLRWMSDGEFSWIIWTVSNSPVRSRSISTEEVSGRQHCLLQCVSE